MSSVRKRYYIWLLKAYFKRWNKTIISSVIIGVLCFFLVFFVINFYVLPVFQKKVQKIGYYGSYTTSTIPNYILSDISYGLTKVDKNGSIEPAAAFKWDITDSGKLYTFYIRRGQYFHNGRELNSSTLPLNFADTKRKNIDLYTVSYALKEPYTPFLTIVSRPLLDSNLNGLGQYKVKRVSESGGFINSLTLENKDNSKNKKIIHFYPTQDALKAAFSLGEIDYAYNIQSIDVLSYSFTDWKNADIKKQTDYTKLIAVFFNNEDKFLSNKKMRQALSYAIPSNIKEGQRAYSPIPPDSIYFSKAPNYGIYDLALSKSLLSDDKDALKVTYEISTPDEYLETAQMVQKAWEKIGIKSEIKTVSSIPSKFQILIYPINLPIDPDQYTLWHTAQADNITKYKNLRIDKLLEDGRSTTDTEKRIGIYSDFQKYLIDDAPATFLYFPTSYSVERM